MLAVDGSARHASPSSSREPHHSSSHWASVSSDNGSPSSSSPSSASSESANNPPRTTTHSSGSTSPSSSDHLLRMIDAELSASSSGSSSRAASRADNNPSAADDDYDLGLGVEDVTDLPATTTSTRPKQQPATPIATTTLSAHRQQAHSAKDARGLSDSTMLEQVDNDNDDDDHNTAVAGSVQPWQKRLNPFARLTVATHGYQRLGTADETSDRRHDHGSNSSSSSSSSSGFGAGNAGGSAADWGAGTGIHSYSSGHAADARAFVSASPYTDGRTGGAPRTNGGAVDSIHLEMMGSSDSLATNHKREQLVGRDASFESHFQEYQEQHEGLLQPKDALHSTIRGGGDNPDNPVQPPLSPRRHVIHLPHGLSDGTSDDPLQEHDGGLWVFIFQIVPALVIAGFGLVSAGILLDRVQHWDVFQRFSEMFILVPALLGLKGNLEMTLACRLSTAAEGGKLDDPSTRWRFALSNLALVLTQAIVVGAVAAGYAVVFGVLLNGDLSAFHTVLLFVCSMVTGFLSSLVLGVIMTGIIVMSRQCSINPTNVATPIAASLGDLVTLAILALVGQFMVTVLDETTSLVVASLLIASLVLSLPLFIAMAKRDQSIATVLRTGWSPILVAMLISSGGGVILERQIDDFPGLAALVPMLCGIGGNIVAIHASRLSTNLNLGRTAHAATERKIVIVLMTLVIPLQLAFLWVIRMFGAGHTSITLFFITGYIVCSLVQLGIMISFSHWLVHAVIRWGMDPDNVVLPYLTSVGDLIGTGTLAASFLILRSLGDGDDDVGE